MGAQEDLAQALVGRWDGQVEFPTGVFGRILIIRSLEQKDGKWVLTAAYGPKGRGLSPVRDASIETTGREVLLKLKVPDGADRRMFPMELTLLKDGKHLVGTIYLAAGARGGSTRPAKFEKAEAAQ
ncbi:MAG TPA: hypothetical protein VFO18_02000 [Methylomirabilota bacterium]|nr:hypothetical protein [Methylomirabilota bacterium]